MSRSPRITGSELIAALVKDGFQVIRVRGSHHFLRHEDGRSTVVPAHSGETLGPGLLHKILRDCHFSVEDAQRMRETDRRT
jgi:predicted RNA binding protein YcfA (HicA-like mRNA interferase family)